MATAQTIINRALAPLLESGESPTAQESSDAFTVLNQLLDSWQNDRLAIYSYQTESLAMDGSSSYTIGPSGDLTTTRPVEIDSAYMISGSTSLPIGIIDKQEYDAIPDKTTTSTLGKYIYYEELMPNGVIYPWPIPTTNTLYMSTRVPLTQFASLSETVSLPPGYTRALSLCLRVELLDDYNRPLSAVLARQAVMAKRSLMKANSKTIKMDTGFNGMFGNYKPNILTGA